MEKCNKDREDRVLTDILTDDALLLLTLWFW